MGPTSTCLPTRTQPANPVGRDGKEINGSPAQRMVPEKRGLLPCQYLGRGAVLVIGERELEEGV